MNTATAKLDTPPRAPGLLRRSWPAFFVLLVTLGLTLLATRLAQDQVATKIDALTEARSGEIMMKLSIAVDQQTDVMRSLQGLYAMNIQVVRDVFELFATVPADLHPSVKCIAFAPRVRETDLTAYQLYARNQGLSYMQFAVHPIGPRPEFFPLEYLVPFTPNSSKLGFDLASEGPRAAAISIAAQTGEITATAVLRSSGESEPTFQLIAPLYEGTSSLPAPEDRAAAFTGVCTVELFVRQFIADAIARDADSSMVSVTVYDGLIPSESTLLFAETKSESAFRTRTMNLKFAGHDWTVEVHSGEGLASAVNTSLPIYVLITGALISLLLFGFVLSLSNSRQRALFLAEKMTRSLRRIVGSSSDIIGSMDLEGNWKNTNEASLAILHYSREELIGKSHDDFVLHADRAHVAEVLHTAPDETSITLEARYRTKEGDVRWISWSITRSATDGEIYCIGRDVTERMIAEKAIEAKSKQLLIAGIITDRENKRKEQSIRDQNIQFRMQLTTVMGFLQLILSQDDFTQDEILDYVKEANVGAEGLLDDIVRMTSVELRRIEDVSFNLQQKNAGELLHIISDRIKVKMPDASVNVEDVPDRLAETQCTMDVEKVEYAVDQIVDVLLPFGEPQTHLKTRVFGGEGTLIAELHFQSANALEPKVISGIGTHSGDIREYENEADFSRALMHSYLDVMDAKIEIEKTDPTPGAVIRFVFPL
ncbi:MAG: CHASE domain-containing protein [Bacteroidota bacterium]